MVKTFLPPVRCSQNPELEVKVNTFQPPVCTRQKINVEEGAYSVLPSSLQIQPKSDTNSDIQPEDKGAVNNTGAPEERTNSAKNTLYTTNGMKDEKPGNSRENGDLGQSLESNKMELTDAEFDLLFDSVISKTEEEFKKYSACSRYLNQIYDNGDKINKPSEEKVVSSNKKTYPMNGSKPPESLNAISASESVPANKIRSIHSSDENSSETKKQKKNQNKQKVTNIYKTTYLLNESKPKPESLDSSYSNKSVPTIKIRSIYSNDENSSETKRQEKNQTSESFSDAHSREDGQMEKSLQWGSFAVRSQDSTTKSQTDGIPVKRKRKLYSDSDSITSEEKLELSSQQWGSFAVEKSFTKNRRNEAARKTNKRIPVAKKQKKSHQPLDSPDLSEDELPAVQIVNTQDCNVIKPPKGLSQRNKIKWYHQNRIVGTWVECDSCKKWRYLKDVEDPVQVPQNWFCNMNDDLRYNSCDKIQCPYLNHKDLIYTCYTAGSLVWAKMDGYPWWPGMVDDDPEFARYYWLSGDSDPDWYHVVFFDYGQVSRGWAHVKYIKPFEKDNPSQFMKQPSTPLSYLSRIKKGVKEALQAAELSISERLKKFSFIARYRGKIYSYKHNMDNFLKEYNLSSFEDSSDEYDEGSDTESITGQDKSQSKDETPSILEISMEVDKVLEKLGDSGVSSREKDKRVKGKVKQANSKRAPLKQINKPDSQTTLLDTETCPDSSLLEELFQYVSPERNRPKKLINSPIKENYFPSKGRSVVKFKPPEIKMMRSQSQPLEKEEHYLTQQEINTPHSQELSEGYTLEKENTPPKSLNFSLSERGPLISCRELLQSSRNAESSIHCSQPDSKSQSSPQEIECSQSKKCNTSVDVGSPEGEMCFKEMNGRKAPQELEEEKYTDDQSDIMGTTDSQLDQKGGPNSQSNQQRITDSQDRIVDSQSDQMKTTGFQSDIMETSDAQLFQKDGPNAEPDQMRITDSQSEQMKITGFQSDIKGTTDSQLIQKGGPNAESDQMRITDSQDRICGSQSEQMKTTGFQSDIKEITDSQLVQKGGHNAESDQMRITDSQDRIDDYQSEQMKDSQAEKININDSKYEQMNGPQSEIVIITDSETKKITITGSRAEPMTFSSQSERITGSQSEVMKKAGSKENLYESEDLKMDSQSEQVMGAESQSSIRDPAYSQEINTPTMQHSSSDLGFNSQEISGLKCKSSTPCRSLCDSDSSLHFSPSQEIITLKFSNEL